MEVSTKSDATAKMLTELRPGMRVRLNVPAATAWAQQYGGKEGHHPGTYINLGLNSLHEFGVGTVDHVLPPGRLLSSGCSSQRVGVAGWYGYSTVFVEYEHLEVVDE